MIKITYPGSSNFSDFVYDPLGRNVKIVETTAGSVTSTKQFVWAVDKHRQFAPCEERDNASVLSKMFFDRGQINGSTKYFYDKDNLGSIRTMTDNSGSVQAMYTFDPFGRISKVTESVAADFQFGGYYNHGRSGLNLALFRAYSSGLGRWLSRDPLEEFAGNNPFAYVSNNPISLTDPLGLRPCNADDPIDTFFWCYALCAGSKFWMGCMLNCLANKGARYGFV